MKNVRIRYLITDIIVTIAIIMTFVPVIKYGQSIPNGDGTFTSIIHYYPLVWFVYQIDISYGLSLSNAIMIVTITLFYICSILVIITSLVNKHYLTNILLVASAILLMPSVRYWYTLIFCITIGATYIIISFINIFIDYRSKELKKDGTNNIGRNIKRYRINNHYTQQELADKIFVSRSLIAKFESGSATPNEYQIEDIAKVLKVSVEDLSKTRLNG